jgi:peptidoglycan/LPS O-acetylase OafA/YrhL
MTEGRTLGQLVAQATHDMSEIVRAEIALAKAELRADVARGAVAGGLGAGAGYLLALATVMLCVAAGYGLGETGLPTWAAFLVVAGALVLIAGILALLAGRSARGIGASRRARRVSDRTVGKTRPVGGGE